MQNLFIKLRDLSQEEYVVHLRADKITAITCAEDDKTSCAVHMEGGEIFWVEISVNDMRGLLNDKFGSPSVSRE